MESVMKSFKEAGKHFLIKFTSGLTNDFQGKMKISFALKNKSLTDRLRRTRKYVYLPLIVDEPNEEYLKLNNLFRRVVFTLKSMAILVFSLKIFSTYKWRKLVSLTPASPINKNL